MRQMPEKLTWRVIRRGLKCATRIPGRFSWCPREKVSEDGGVGVSEWTKDPVLGSVTACKDGMTTARGPQPVHSVRFLHPDTPTRRYADTFCHPVPSLHQKEIS
jgi:hypothetical protein